MLNAGTTGTIHVAVESQDGRKGIDGLAGVVRTVLGRDPASGSVTTTHLAMILGGVELARTRTRKRFQHTA